MRRENKESRVYFVTLCVLENAHHWFVQVVPMFICIGNLEPIETVAVVQGIGFYCCKTAMRRWIFSSKQ